MDGFNSFPAARIKKLRASGREPGRGKGKESNIRIILEAAQRSSRMLLYED